MGTAQLRRVLFAAAATAVAGLSVAVVSGSARAAGPTPFAATGALRICTSCPQTGGNLARYGYVILNAWDAPRIPALKAANPGLKVLLYKNLSFSVDYDCSGAVDRNPLPTGVGYCDANVNHPGWFLKDPSGNRLNSANFSSSWMMDVGNPDYQKRWLANVQAEVKSEGWDGVFADDTDADMSWHLNGRTMAKYPTTRSWQAATRSMLARVGPALTSQGILFIPNVAAPWSPGYDAQALWKDWLQFTSGAAQEYYSKWGTDSSSWFTGSDWTFRQQFQLITEAAGKIFLGITYAPQSDTRSMLYARANFLLNARAGGRSALIFEPGDHEATDPYSPVWTADVGTPRNSRYQVGRAWRRDFTGGTVLVNPSTVPVTVRLGAGYRNASGVAVSSVTLQPATGALLTSGGTVSLADHPAPIRTISLSARARAATHTVRLVWKGMPSRKVNLFHNDRWFVATANDGVSSQRLAGAATGTYRVCALNGSICTKAVAVVRG